MLFVIDLLGGWLGLLVECYVVEVGNVDGVCGGGWCEVVVGVD